MQVQFGGKTFIKTKFDGLDGKTIVQFVNEDESIKGRATKSEMSLTLHVSATNHEEAVAVLELLRGLLKSTWEEHLKLKPSLTLNRAGH